MRDIGELNKVNRRTSPYSALRDYIAQLHIIERQMRMRISLGVVLTASSARAAASLYIRVQLHFFSCLNTHRCIHGYPTRHGHLCK